MKRFWGWYEHNYTLNVGIASSLFLLQLVHLYWLFTDVILFRLTGESFFDPSRFWELVIIIVDYAEIPAIFAASLLYLNTLRLRFAWKPILMLIFINSQWLHLFWITDELVISQLVENANLSMFPVWLAWIAIGIDYLELPVIYDTLKIFISRLRK